MPIKSALSLLTNKKNMTGASNKRIKASVLGTLNIKIQLYSFLEKTAIIFLCLPTFIFLAIYTFLFLAIDDG